MSIWTRFSSRFQQSFGFKKKPVRFYPKPQLTQLEDRVVPAHLTYHGGDVINNVIIQPIYYGSLWKNDTSLTGDLLNKESKKITEFLKFISSSSYMDAMSQYVPNPRGTVAVTNSLTGVHYNEVYLDTDNASDSSKKVSDGGIINDIKKLTATGSINSPDKQMLYMVFLPPGFDSDQPDSSGYHSNDGNMNYAVVEYGNDFNDITLTASHELAEAVTDPNGRVAFKDNGAPGSSSSGKDPNDIREVAIFEGGWYDDSYIKFNGFKKAVTAGGVIINPWTYSGPTEFQAEICDLDTTIDGNEISAWFKNYYVDSMLLNSYTSPSTGITQVDQIIVPEYVPNAPSINFPANLQIKATPNYHIKGVSVVPDSKDDILTYSWKCISKNSDDVIIYNDTFEDPMFTFGDNGLYKIELTVGYSNWYSRTGEKTITKVFDINVINADPTVSFSGSAQTVSNFGSNFGISVSDPEFLDVKSLLIDIDYGDGLSLVRQSWDVKFDHAYLNPGTYTINITAVDKDGGKGTATQQVTVKSFGIVSNPFGGGDMLAVGGTQGVDEVHLNTLDGETFSGTVNGEVIGPIVVPSHAASIRTGADKDFVALGLGQGKGAIPTKVNVDMGVGNDKFASFSHTAGASARSLGNGLYQYSYFGGGNAYVAVVGNETPIIEPNVDDSYVAAIYHKVLERNPSKGEVKLWSKQFATEPYEYIAHNIFYSVERSAKTVNNWYQTYMGRAASKSEAQPWVNLIVAGKNEEETLAKFLGSREYIARQGSGTAFINSLYNQFLGRNASQAAINSWFRDYGNPPNYYEVAKAILTSKEYQAREITSYYDRFLDRHQASVSGFANNNAFARRGVGPREVSDLLFANVSPHAARYQMLWSPEFRVNGL